jgi:hypothetical protein
MPLFRRRNKAGAPHGPVSEVNPHADLVRIPGVPRPGSAPLGNPQPAPQPERIPLEHKHSEEHLKAPSNVHIGYNNRQVSEAMDNVAKNNYPSTHANIADALKRLNGRD